MKRALLLLAVLLAACGEPGDSPAPKASAIASATPAAAPSATPLPEGPAPASLVGEYRVAGVDGKDIDAPVGLTLSIDARRIDFIDCANFVWDYTYDAGALTMTRAVLPENRPICRIVAQAVEVGDALDEVDHARRTPANGIELSGNGRTVLLFSQ